MDIFYYKLIGVFLASGLAFKYMMIMQKRKEDEADRKFQQTLQMIELRAKIRKERENDNIQSTTD